MQSWNEATTAHGLGMRPLLSHGLGMRLLLPHSQEWTNMIHLPQMKTADTARENFCKCDQARVSQAEPRDEAIAMDMMCMVCPHV